MNRLAIRWKLAGAYFILIVVIISTANLFLLRVLERQYLQERETTWLTNANIVATSAGATLLRTDRNAYHAARDFGSRMGSRVLVVDLNGRVVVDSFGEGWLEGRLLEHVEVQAALSGSSQTGVHTLDAGERVLYTAVPLLEEKRVAGAVMLVSGLDDVYGQLGQIRSQMTTASLLSGILAGLLSMLLAGFLTRPVKELTDGVRQVARGHLEQRIPVRGGDELGRLAESFNEMSTRLADADRTRRRFLADASHELKSPLSSIKALAQSLTDSNEQDPVVYREYLGDINTEADRLARIVDNMLQLTRLEEDEVSLTRTEEDMRGLVEHVTVLVAPLARQADVTLRVEMEPGLRWIINRDLVTRVLFNLLDNALRHTPAGGSVTLEAAAEKIL